MPALSCCGLSSLGRDGSGLPVRLMPLDNVLERTYVIKEDIGWIDRAGLIVTKLYKLYYPYRLDI